MVVMMLDNVERISTKLWWYGDDDEYNNVDYDDDVWVIVKNKKGPKGSL